MTRIYSHRGGYAIGDTVTLVDYLLRESQAAGEPARLSKVFPPKPESKEISYDIIERYQRMIDTPGRIMLVEEPGDFVTEQPKIWDKSRLWVKPHLRWDGGSAGTVVLQLDGKSGKEAKNPPAADLPRFMALPNARHIGLPMTLEESVEAMRTARLMIAVCSGLSHVCHAVGTPLIIVEYRQTIACWHPPANDPRTPWHHAKGTDHALAIANDLLRKTA